MSSFSCQFLDSAKSYCIRLKKDCIPGRQGCVLKGRYVFATPVEKRINDTNKDKSQEKNRK